MIIIIIIVSNVSPIIDGMIILKWVCTKLDGGHGLDCSGRMGTGDGPL
jgi:hypothetical protein